MAEVKNKISSVCYKINKYIENMKEWQWLLIAFIICLISMISISVRILWEPYIRAEDGRVFVQDAINYGKSSLFTTWAGYLAVLPRLFAIIAVHFGRKYNSLILIVTITKWCNIFFSVIVANYINSKEFKFIVKNRILRLIISILLMFVVANYGAMLYTGVTIHWWGGLLAFFIGLNFINGKMPPLYIIPFLLLSILSSPSALIVGIAILYYLFTKRNLLKDKKRYKEIILNNKLKIFILTSIAITAILEIYVILFLGNQMQLPSNSNMTNGGIINVCIQTIKATCKNIPYVFSFRKLTSAFAKKVKLILGGVILVILLWRYIKNKNMKIFVFGLLTMIILNFMALFRYDGKFELPNSNFYSAIQSTVGVFLVIKCLFDELCKTNKIIKTIFVLFLIVLILIFKKYAIIPEYESSANIYDIENRVNFSSKKVVKVKIALNEKWYIFVPVDE